MQGANGLKPVHWSLRIAFGLDLARIAFCLFRFSLNLLLLLCLYEALRVQALPCFLQLCETTVKLSKNQMKDVTGNALRPRYLNRWPVAEQELYLCQTCLFKSTYAECTWASQMTLWLCAAKQHNKVLLAMMSVTIGGINILQNYLKFPLFIMWEAIQTFRCVLIVQNRNQCLEEVYKKQSEDGSWTPVLISSLLFTVKRIGAALSFGGNYPKAWSITEKAKIGTQPQRRRKRTTRMPQRMAAMEQNPMRRREHVVDREVISCFLLLLLFLLRWINNISAINFQHYLL